MPIFTFSVISLFVGQTLILILFLVAFAWRLLQRGSDHAAGAVLACLTTKPQLTGVLVLLLLLWSARQRRWAVVRGFALALAALGSCERPIRPVVAHRDASSQPADAASHDLLPLDRHHVVSHPQDDRAFLMEPLGPVTSVSPSRSSFW